MADPQKPPAAPRYDYSDAHPRVRTVRVHRSGNSLGVYIPHVIAKQVGWEKHDELRLYIVGRVVCLQSSKRESWTPGVVAVSPLPLKMEC